MKSVFRLLPFLFLLGLSAYLPGVRAETCRANIGQTTVNIPNIKYLPTLPVNTQMTSAMADNGSGIPFSCDLQLPTASAKRIVYKQLKTGGSPMVINGQHVYPSAIDGIGYALSFQLRRRPDACHRWQPLRRRRVGGGMRQCDAPGADDAAANHGEDCGNLL
ncbi:fimbrial-like protein [Klebsiella pneumoniae]|uniref:Fimbrial-like protein n=1 Tax=Klebsiella pneumoniae TaxID=573 RepID=A0A2X3CF44_KLEPN|nr:fimbrial-like protein [Klebsiella pneumoniae]